LKLYSVEYVDNRKIDKNYSLVSLERHNNIKDLGIEHGKLADVVFLNPG